ncbi:TonB system transport protein ExbD [Helicobacter sp. MIT 14-3879]|uniref:TonB system transport protein ExbD n=1 Tax=Helicobacter sp. MIT 14-3879 TaxID=2040649 RepID=UPI000E1EEA4D|nr:TonB system transport protein ExbD [Helicobacter sp. MIT 14-3879]RDU65591.1 TonB system transport protein ExbD [Helicobacter sp. MIT 14-3879]
MRLPRKEGLNIVPFIDIMLVLLAIVLSAATFISQGQIKINIPQSSSASKVENNKKLSIILDKENKFYIDDKETSIDEVKNKIMNLDKEILVELASDSDAKFQSFIEILDILKEKGHENFTIQAKIKK